MRYECSSGNRTVALNARGSIDRFWSIELLPLHVPRLPLTRSSPGPEYMRRPGRRFDFNRLESFYQSRDLTDLPSVSQPYELPYIL